MTDKLIEEVLTELSKKTLGSYVTKATSRASDESRKAGKWNGFAFNSNNPRPLMDKAMEHDRKAHKRHIGIHSAVAKLTKEELEELAIDLAVEAGVTFDLSEELIVELAKETLKSYVDKASEDRAERTEKAEKYDAAAENVKKNSPKHRKYIMAANKHMNIADKRKKGIATASKKLKEENEGVQPLSEEDVLLELSKRTLASYVSKASKDAADHEGLHAAATVKANNSTGEKQAGFDELADKWQAKSEKRLKGVTTAAKKLAKEEFDALVEEAEEVLTDFYPLNEEEIDVLDLFFGQVVESFDLTEEELQELSRKTLRNYIQKAAQSAYKHGNESRKYEDKVDWHKNVSSAKRKELHKKIAHHQGKEEKRLGGIVKATDRMWADPIDEEVELQELSKETLRSYQKKAFDDIAKKDKKARSIEKKHNWRPTQPEIPEVSKLDKKVEKRITGTWNAHLKLKEETELQELSSKILAAYRSKASEDKKDLHHARDTYWKHRKKLDAAGKVKEASSAYKHGAMFDDKADKRQKGILKATDKLTKEDVAILVGLGAASLGEVTDLGEEVLLELSKETLKSYMTKATRDMKKSVAAGREAEAGAKQATQRARSTSGNRSRSSNDPYSHESHLDAADAASAEADKHFDRANKRQKGVETASKKLKEETELAEIRHPSAYELELKRDRLKRLGERFRKKMEQEIQKIDEV